MFVWLYYDIYNYNYSHNYRYSYNYCCYFVFI